MKRTHLLVALTGLVLALPLAATGANAPITSTCRTAGSRRGSRSRATRSTWARSRPAGSGGATSVQGRARSWSRIAGEPAIGVDVDHRNRLFVAGGPTGDGYVYDARTGADIAQFNFTDDNSFVNDVVVTKRAAWFTDSTRPFLYKVPIGRHGQLGAAQSVPLTGDIVYQGGFNVNGIDATPNGKKLIIVQTNTGQLFKVNRQGVAHLIALGGATVPGDGILLHGKRLFAVVRSPQDGVVVIKLRSNLSSGTVLRTITSDDLDDPTTIDEHGSRLYAVNARFSTPPGPDVPYWVTKLKR